MTINARTFGEAIALSLCLMLSACGDSEPSGGDSGTNDNNNTPGISCGNGVLEGVEDCDGQRCAPGLTCQAGTCQ